MADETAPVPATRPGYKTTEFWITLLVTIISTLYASGVISPEGGSPTAKVIAFIAAALASLGYTVSRGVAKKA